MRTGISITITRSVRGRLEAITRDRNASQKHAWRAAIILSSADGVGTNEIMRRTGKSKTCVWRWQERFMKEGIDGLLHDKTRPSRIPPLGPEVAARVVALTLADPPVERAVLGLSLKCFNRGEGPKKPHLTVGSMQFHKQQRLPKAAVSPFVMHATRKTSVSLLRCYHRSTSVQSTVSTTALTVASSTRSASASSAATVLR